MIYRIIILSLLINSFLYSQTWKSSDLPLIGRIDDVCEADTNTLFLAAKRTIYRSDNAGINWKPVASHGELGYVRSIKFLNNNLGFIGLLKSDTSQNILFRTRDGGKTIEPVLKSTTNTEGICGLSFFNKTIIGVGTFAGNPRVHISKDTGENWKTIKLDSFIGGIVDCHLVNEDTIFISGTSTNKTKGKPIILRSTDGGQSWDSVLFFNSNSSGYFWKMYFGKNRTIYASLQLLQTRQSPDIKLFISHDLGLTWDSKFIDGAQGDNGGVAFINENIGWIGNQYFDLFFTTMDGGNTWERQSPILNTAVNRMIITHLGIPIACGNTIYYLDSSQINTVYNHKLEHREINSLSISPNPVKDNLVLNLHTEESTFSIFELYDLNSNVIKATSPELIPQGKSKKEIDVRGIPNGEYLVVWKNSHQFNTKTFMKME